MKAHKQILVAVDLTSHSDQVMNEALQIARAFDGELIVVHVVHELKSLFGVYVCDQPIDSLQEEILDEARHKLAHLVEKKLAKTGVPFRTVLLHGTPWTEIVNCAIENDAEQIVIGSHVTERPVHKILGSTAERILRSAPCSVLLVPPCKLVPEGREIIVTSTREP